MKSVFLSSKKDGFTTSLWPGAILSSTVRILFSTRFRLYPTFKPMDRSGHSIASKEGHATNITSRESELYSLKYPSHNQWSLYEKHSGFRYIICHFMDLRFGLSIFGAVMRIFLDLLSLPLNNSMWLHFYGWSTSLGSIKCWNSLPSELDEIVGPQSNLKDRKVDYHPRSILHQACVAHYAWPFHSTWTNCFNILLSDVHACMYLAQILSLRLVVSVLYGSWRGR